jgi:hypothetical protein
MPNPTQSVDVGQDEHTYGPGQVAEFGEALIQAGIPYRTFQDEDGELVHEFDCRAPRVAEDPRTDQNAQIALPIGRPYGRAPRQATNARTRGSRRRSSRSSRPPDDGDPEPPRSRRLDGRRDIEAWVAERRPALSEWCCGKSCSRCVRKGAS